MSHAELIGKNNYGVPSEVFQPNLELKNEYIEGGSGTKLRVNKWLNWDKMVSYLHIAEPRFPLDPRPYCEFIAVYQPSKTGQRRMAMKLSAYTKVFRGEEGVSHPDLFTARLAEQSMHMFEQQFGERVTLFEDTWEPDSVNYASALEWVPHYMSQGHDCMAAYQLACQHTYSAGLAYGKLGFVSHRLYSVKGDRQKPKWIQCNFWR